MEDTNSHNRSEASTQASQGPSADSAPKRGRIWHMYMYLGYKYYLLLLLGVVTAISAGLLSVTHHLIIREMLREIYFEDSRFEIAGEINN